MSFAKDLFFQIYESKTIYRILLNWNIKNECKKISGKILDLAGGRNASYYKFFPQGVSIIKSNLHKDDGVDIAIDLNKKIGIDDGSLDCVLFFNAIYIVESPEDVIKEIFRILKKGGMVYMSSPFIAAEMREPNDYCRLTSQGLEKLILSTGFSKYRIIEMGGRFTAASYLLHDFWYFRVIRMIVYPLSIFLDKCVPKKIKKIHPCPLGYFCILEK